MHLVIAGTVSLGMLTFAIGIGTFLLYFSEAEAISWNEGEASAVYEQVNEKAMRGVLLAAIGGSLAIFAIMIDEDRRAEERKKEKGFFF